MQNNTFPTSFVGQNLINLSAVDSTNNFLKNLLSNSEPLPQGTVIMAEDQYGGRGQMGAVWHAQPGKNLTFSVLFYPTFLNAGHQFMLNMAVSLAVADALSGWLPHHPQLKWPNDIYYNNAKLGGILIENTLLGNRLKSAVVGIGINVNQADFSALRNRNITSVINILQMNVDKMSLLTDICKRLEQYYTALSEGKQATICKQYIKKLYRYGQKTQFKANGRVFEGEITGVDETGRLLVLEERNVLAFKLKEIEFIT